MVVLVAIVAVGFAGLLAAPDAAVAWVVVIGIGQGVSLGLALILPVLRGAGAAAVAGLTALALSAGYLLSAVGRRWSVSRTTLPAGGRCRSRSLSG